MLSRLRLASLNFAYFTVLIEWFQHNPLEFVASQLSALMMSQKKEISENKKLFFEKNLI